MAELVEMRDAVYREADVLGLIDEADVDAILNEELGELYELLVEQYQDYSVTTADLQILTGQTEIALPEDFFKGRDVEYLGAAGTSEPVPLKSFLWKNRHRVFGERKYCYHATKLLVRPSLSAPGYYRLHYVPRYEHLEVDSDEFNAPNDWHLYAVMGACARIVGDIQKLDATEFKERKAALKNRITAAAHRDAGEPEVPRDHRGRATLDWWYDPSDQLENG